MKLPGLKNPVAYFCAEFAIDNELPTYSGGLGILAADFINEVAFKHYPMVGMSILYKGKDFLQHIKGDGKAETRDSEFDHDTSFLRPTTIEGKPLIISIPLQNKEILVKSYHLRLSDNTILFFLSTDVDGNPEEWVTDMNALYKGKTESQIRQQILLGVGGMKLLKKLDINPKIYHINEGRPEFIIWELAKKISESEKIPFSKAWKKSKEKIIYTNHTLVDAGNPTYPKVTIEKWASYFAKSLGVEPRLLIEDGLVDDNTFSTTLFALNISKKQTCVSKIHSEYAKREWPDYDFIPITNGVNMNRWQDSDFRKKDLTDNQLWEQHMIKKKELVNSVIKRTGIGYDPERLIISWARRLAEYKQPKTIFTDIKKLKEILTNNQKPIQLLFAGNSHSADPKAGSIIEEIIQIFSSELSGHAIFIPNYNISLANHMVTGSDVWLNTPKGNLEACGTSGMKAISNGLLNLTVIDGWTHEVNWDGIGWTLNPNNVSGSFYELLEGQIAPLYYNRGSSGLPNKWMERMRKSIKLAYKFSTERMFTEYKEKLYS